MISERYLEAIKKFEGFTARATPDYGQLSNGYGTKALYAGEVIDRVEAERRFYAEIENAARLVDNFSPNLPAGAKAALTSLTYNAGTKWMGSGLGESIKRGDMEAASLIITEYNKAGGKVLPGLQARRRDEAQWLHLAASEAGSANDTKISPSSVEPLPPFTGHKGMDYMDSAVTPESSRKAMQHQTPIAFRFAAIEHLIQTVFQTARPVAKDKENDV